jgi:hypothetical protein
MRVPGYCTECRRFRVVSASGHAVVMSQITGVVEGMCDECEEKSLPGGRRF